MDVIKDSTIAIDGVSLNQAQLAIYLACQNQEKGSGYNNPFLLRFNKDIDEKKLLLAIEKTFKNHPGLFASISVRKDGLPVMKYSKDFAKEAIYQIQKVSEKDFIKIKSNLIQPFEITKDKLFRVKLFKTEKYIHLFIDIHHIIFDGYSLNILMSELTKFYEGKDVPSEEYTAFDVSIDEAKNRSGKKYEEAKKWYLEKFADVEEVSLPQGDKKDNEIKFDELTMPLGINLKDIKLFCTKNQCSENSLTTAAFGSLLSLCTMNRKAAFATIYNGRNDKKYQNTISMFVKTLPVLCQNDANLTVEEYVNNVQTSLLGSMMHSVYSFSELASNSGFTSEVMFAYQGELFEIADLKKLHIEREELSFNATGEKLAAQLYVENGKLVLNVQYQSNLYSEQWIKDFAKRYESILNAFLNTKDLKDVSLVNKEELEDILKISYGGDLTYDKTKTFIDLFLEQVKKRPNKEAVYDSVSSYTYIELDKASNRVAHYLISQKIKKGEFITLKVNRVKEFFAGFIGAQKAGLGYVPVDPAYPEDRIEYMIEDSKSKITLTEKLISEIISKEKDDSPINMCEVNSPAYMIYTSGSTGKPKGVVISQHALANFLAWNIADFKVNENSVVAEHPSFSFDASVIDLYTPLIAGASVHVLNEEVRKDLDLTYQYLVDHKITNICMSTQIGMSMINLHPDVPLKYIIIGGEKFLQVAKTKVKIYNAYGPTEFTVSSSYQLVDQNSEKDVPIGKAVKNTYSFICDYNGNLLPLGMIGEICLAGPQLSEGYFHREELNLERFIPCRYLKGQKMYRTGDLAKYNEEGTIDYCGRIDFQVKLRGFRIELGEIENTAANYPGINQSIALVKNKLLVLYFVADKKIDEADLKAHMASSLTEYMVPNIYIQLDNMPLTPGGKIDRKALPEIENKSTDLVKPTNEDEQKIYDILVKILGYEDFGVTDDFNNIGLTSLSAMQFASMLSTSTNKTIRVNDLVKYPSIQKIASFLSSKSEESTYKIQKYYPLTMNQKGILTEVLAHPSTTIYNIPFVIDLPLKTDLDKFENAFKKAVDAHPFLKAKIISDKDNNFMLERNDDLGVKVVRLPLESLKEGVEELVKPFDLLKEPLYRAYILESKSGSKFLFDAHHIVFDGESLDALYQDLNKVYKDEKINKETYTEYELALDEAKLRESETYIEAKDYYTKLLDGHDTDSCLVNDISETGIGKKSFDLTFKLSRKEIDKYVLDNKTTINSLWISSIGFALAKYLNREDALFTTVYNGRSDSRVLNDVGMFVHTFPVVVEPFKTKTALDYVRNVGQQIQQNMAHDLYSFMEIAHDFGVRTDILFVYEGKISQNLKLGDEEIKNAVLLPNNEAKAALLIAVNDVDEGFNIHIEYNGDKYQEWSLKSFLGSVMKVFEALIKNEELSKINLLDKEDYKKIDQYNATEVEIVKDDIVSEFRNAAKKYPNNLAVIFKNNKYTYAEVDKLSDHIAYYLASKGIGKGDVVSILISRSEYMPISALGVLKTGAAYQPLDCSYPEDRLLFMIKDANAKHLIAEKDLLNKIPGCKLPVLDVKDIKSLKSEKVALKGPDKDSLFILLYTSGTTGTPKGVMLKHLNLVNFCAWYHRFYNLKPESVVSAYAGFGFDACMMDMYPALTNGSAVCIVPDELRMNLDQLANYFALNHVSHSFMTTQVGRLFATEGYQSTLKYLSVGGEKLTPLDPPKGYKLFNGYGPTECTIFSTAYLVDKMYHRIPIGKPLDNYKLYVVDNYGQQVPNGALGELWISGLGVGLGYLNLKEKTEQTFIKNPFTNQKGYERIYRTGDIVRRLEDGTIDFIGRNDGQVKIRGFRIELSEVEMAIRSFEGIKDVTVQAFDLEAGGKFLAAYFTSDKKIDIDALKKHIKENKPAYMVPASIMQIEAIPLNQNQKVNKRALPAPCFTEEGKQFVEASNEVEKAFVNAYQDILGIDKVSVTDNFFDIGGTSLTAANVVIFALNHGYQITYQDIFAHPSPRDLAEFLKGNKVEVKKEDKSFEKDAERKSLKYNDIEYVDDIKLERDLGKVLLAGATGFLGIHLFRELLSQKRHMTILVRARDIDPVERMKGLLMYYFDSPLDEEFDKYVKVVNADITSNNLLEELKDYEFDTIINAAAIVKHFANDDSIERVNVGGVINLIEVAKAHKARFVHVSTVSVAGENIDHKFPSNFLMKENQLYFGQDLSNKYANSKFKAEEALLDAYEKDGLDVKIIRVGNLMSRQKDGEFQINSITNNFMRSLKGYKVLGEFPISSLDQYTDFSPIDETAKTILLLGQVPKKFTVFHSFNSHTVQMGDVIDAMDLAGLHMDKVSDKEFNESVKEAMKDSKKSVIVSTLLNYNSSDNLSHEFIQGDPTFTVKALYRLGYRWSITDFDYLIRAIKSLDSLGFFERDDM